MKILLLTLTLSLLCANLFAKDCIDLSGTYAFENAHCEVEGDAAAPSALSPMSFEHLAASVKSCVNPNCNSEMALTSSPLKITQNNCHSVRFDYMAMDWDDLIHWDAPAFMKFDELKFVMNTLTQSGSHEYRGAFDVTKVKNNINLSQSFDGGLIISSDQTRTYSRFGVPVLQNSFKRNCYYPRKY